MSNRIQIKRSNNASNTPGINGVAALVAGELAINFAQNGGEGKIYFGNNSGTTTDITKVLSGITNAQLAGSIADSKLSTISTANKVSISALDIDGATAVSGGAVAAADLIIIDDGAGGTNRKATLGNLATKLGGAGLGVSGATLSVGVDDSTIEISSDALQIKDSGVGTNQIANDAVDSQHLAAGGIDEEHIANRAVTSDKIGLQAVVAGLLQNSTSSTTGAVTSDKFRPGAVNTAALGPDAVTSDKIGDDQITNDHIAANAVQTAMIANNAVTGDKLADSITIAQNLTVDGNLTVAGDTTTLSVSTLEVEDTFIELNKGIQAAGTEDTVDVGIYTAYDTNSSATDSFAFTGLGRDASQDKWILFKELLTEPSSTPGAIATMGSTNSRTGTLQANLEGLSGFTNTIVNYKIDCGTF
tara:strand:+ start:2749 stop:3996 length:1248 start_codon:yes stop_codon:yes gene_type:complete